MPKENSPIRHCVTDAVEWMTFLSSDRFAPGHVQVINPWVNYCNCAEWGPASQAAAGDICDSKTIQYCSAPSRGQGSEAAPQDLLGRVPLPLPSGSPELREAVLREGWRVPAASA